MRSKTRTSWPWPTSIGATRRTPSTSIRGPRSTKTSARCSTRRRASTRSSWARPDHNHAIVSMAAIRRGKHVYCEKPLTHTVYEARPWPRPRGKHKVATQMGNQGMAFEGNRLMTEWIEDGAIGPVREAHVWSDRPTHSGKTAAVVAARHRAAAGEAARARVARLGPLARPGAVAALPSGLRSLPLARLVGFRFRRPGRHGDSQHRPRLLIAEARGAASASMPVRPPSSRRRCPWPAACITSFPPARACPRSSCTGTTAGCCRRVPRNWKTAGSWTARTASCWWATRARCWSRAGAATAPA